MTSGDAASSSAAAHRDRNAPQMPRAKPGEFKPKDRETLLREAAQLETLLLKRAVTPEKMLVAAELGYMRRQLLSDRKRLSVTYPVNPPFAFVHIYFSEADEEFDYVALEPTLKPEEKEQIAKIRARMEAMMGQEELPITAGTTLEQSPELQEYMRKRFLTVLDLYDIAVPEKRRPVLLYYLQRDFLGLGRTDADATGPVPGGYQLSRPWGASLRFSPGIRLASNERDV